MNKPTTMLKEEFEQNLIQLINNANLPPFVIELVLKNLCLEIKELANKQALREKEEYNHRLAEEQKERVNGDAEGRPESDKEEV